MRPSKIFVDTDFKDGVATAYDYNKAMVGPNPTIYVREDLYHEAVATLENRIKQLEAVIDNGRSDTY